MEADSLCAGPVGGAASSPCMCVQVIPLILPYCLIQWARGKLTRENIILPDWKFIGMSFLVSIGCESGQGVRAP